MQARDAYDQQSRNGSLMLVAAAMAVALVAGSVTALAGSMAGTRAVYLVAVPSILALGAAFALTRPQPLRVAFLVLMAVLPFVSMLMPPGRLGLTVFDVATLLLTIGLLLHKAFVQDADAPLFPAPSLAWIWLLLIPCVAFARHPLDAARGLLLIFAAYVFFWFVLQELRRPGGPERLVGLLCMTAIIVSVGLFIDYAFHINLSLRGNNPNQLTFTAGRYIWRAGGFFQDPQRAGAFLASLLMFLLMLGIRGRFQGPRLRLLLWATITIALAALFLTVSRAAILTFMVVGVVSLVAMNRWPLFLKLGGVAALLLMVVGLIVAPEFWLGLLPASLADRVAASQEEIQARVAIWVNTWEMFAGQPVTGIGMEGFAQYLLDTRPGTTDYFGLYETTGMSYIPDQPESGYLKILYESGILGSVATLLLIGATLRRAVRTLTGAGDGGARTEVIAALASLAVFAGTFVTLFTVSDPRLLALFAILLAFIWRPSSAPIQHVRS
ncbi:MAG TPA: O-antigen ligase family protein [Steroidobacteraceae bacterium]|nr:O-antigen ligase family protein [Steroidobacteraceae bacterium]